jgi:uncharacterized protein
MHKPLFSERHPYWFVTLLELLIIVVYLASGTATYLLKLPTMGLYAIANAILTLLGVIFLTVSHRWKTMGFKPLARPGDLALFSIWLITIVINLAFGMQFNSLAQAAGLLGIAAMVGFVEETFFRGFILRALQSKGLWQSVLVSSVLFGVTHAMNVLGGKDTLAAALQVCYALAIGIACSALALRTGVIWPLVIGHALTDFAGFMQPAGLVVSPGMQSLVAGVTTLVFAGYGIYVMRQVVMGQNLRLMQKAV